MVPAVFDSGLRNTDRIHEQLERGIERAAYVQRQHNHIFQTIWRLCQPRILHSCVKDVSLCKLLLGSRNTLQTCQPLVESGVVAVDIDPLQRGLCFSHSIKVLLKKYGVPRITLHDAG